jgi:hypothetical protein
MHFPEPLHSDSLGHYPGPQKGLYRRLCIDIYGYMDRWTYIHTYIYAYTYINIYIPIRPLFE